MKKLKGKQLFCCALAMIMTAQMGTTIFAAQSENETTWMDNTEVKVIDDNTIGVSSANGDSAISVDEGNGIRTITITNLTTGQKDIIQYDSNSNTVYSSLTEETINLDENQELSPEAPTIASRSVSSYDTKYISYA